MICGKLSKKSRPGSGLSCLALVALLFTLPLSLHADEEKPTQLLNDCMSRLETTTNELENALNLIDRQSSLINEQANTIESEQRLTENALNLLENRDERLTKIESLLTELEKAVTRDIWAARINGAAVGFGIGAVVGGTIVYLIAK